MNVYTEITGRKRTLDDDGIGPGATAGIVITLLFIITIITVVVITVVIILIRKKTKNTKCEKGNKEFETLEESQDYIQMQTCEPYSLHKVMSPNTQEPDIKYDLVFLLCSSSFSILLI